MNIKTYLIFDFDGTLVDSFRIVCDKFNLLADQFSFRKVYDHEISGLRDLTSLEFIKHLEIPLYKIPRVILQARKHMRAEMATLRPFVNLPNILSQLLNGGVSLGILTSNSVANVSSWLKKNNMLHLFSFIHSESNFFGKARVLKRIIRVNSIDKSRVYYIGDETRDIEAAKQCGVHSVAVTWGFNSEKILLQHQPHFVLRKPEELLGLVTGGVNS